MAYSARAFSVLQWDSKVILSRRQKVASFGRMQLVLSSLRMKEDGDLQGLISIWLEERVARSTTEKV
jgi:hypothetical protein